MSFNFSTNPNAAPAPVSFDNFSFSFSRPSLLQRLGMNGPSNPPPPNGGDDLTIPTSLDTSNHLAAEGTSNTIPISSADSSSVPPASVISQQNSVIASQPTDMDPAEPNIRGMSPSDVPMEIDERASPDAGESPVTPTLSSGSRVPEIYRSLSPTNYFVAPPDVLPYPRSPVRQFPEGHPLHTQPSIFGYLPRVPPRSPRLDPLAVLELESERERSEWDQVRKDLGRPSRPTSPVVRVAPTPIDVSALPRSNNPSSAVDASFIAFSESGYESESSDAELRVFDHDDETPTTSHPATGSVHRTLVPLGAQPLGGAGPVTAPPGPTSTSVPNLNGRFSGTETQPTFNAGGPASTPPPKDKSGESGASTPAKRKFDEVEQPAHGSTKGFENKAAGRPSEARGGVPPPLRLQLDRVPTSQSGTPTPPPSVPSTARPTPATATSASTDQVGQSSIASAPGSAPASSNLATVATAPATRNICKFHNRPPGRVCVRKDACPDLHEGPLQAPAPWTYLQSSTPPLKTPPATEQSTFVVQPPPTVVPGTVPAPAPASVPAPIASAPKAAPAKTSPNAPIASATVVPPQGVSTPAPGPVPPQTGPSKATRSQTAASKATRAPATVPNPNPKPAASTDGTRAPAKENRRAPPACRFYSTPKGCGKGANCPFKHEDKNASGSASGPTSSSTTPQPIRSGDAPSSQAPVPTPGPSQVTLAQPNGPGPQTRKTSSGNVLKPAPNHSLPPKPAAFIGSGAGDLPPRELGVVQQPSGTNAQASSPNQKTKPPQAAKKKASQANTTKIKVEESSPGPSLSQNTPAPQVDRPTARPAPVTREIKQEDVTLYDIGQADEEMTDNTAQASSNGGSILPTSLTAPARPPGVPSPAPSLPATQGAAPVNPAASIHARISPPQPTAESAAPLAASPIPVAPSRPPANGQKVASNAPAPPANQRSVSSSNAKPTSSASSRPSGPPVSQTARVPEARQEPERRELLSRLQERPEPRRTGADTYRPAYQGQPRLPRSASRSRSPVRSRSRSISPRRGNTRATRYREYSPIIRSPSPPRQSLYARFGGVDRNAGRAERRRPRSRSRSRSPGRYGQSYSPMEWAPRSPGPRNRSPPSSRSRSRSPPRRASYNEREYDYRGATTTRAPVSRNRSPPPQRTVAPAPRDGYSGGSAYFPPENHIPRPWERTQSSGTTSTSGVVESANAVRGEQDSRYPRTSKPRLVDMFELPSGSSTPGGPRPAPTYAQSNPEPILDDGYDYEHSRTMDISPPDSPVPQYHLQERLQDRINPPSGYHTPTESGGALLTRMAQDIEPPALLERVSSARGPPPNRAPQRGAAPSGNRAQRAPARHPGENAPPLSHRLMDERGSYPDYYNQPADMNPPHRNSDVIGGTLMARMVGRTTGIDINFTVLPEHPISLKLYLNGCTRQALQEVAASRSLHWEVEPIDVTLADGIELRIYENCSVDRKIRIATVKFRAHQLDPSSSETKINDNVGLVPSIVKFNFSRRVVPVLLLKDEAPHSASHNSDPRVLRIFKNACDMVFTILETGPPLLMEPVARQLSRKAEYTLNLCQQACEALEKEDKYDKLVVELIIWMSETLPPADTVRIKPRVEGLHAAISGMLQLVQEISRFVVEYKSDGVPTPPSSSPIVSTARQQVDILVEGLKKLKVEFDIGMVTQLVLGLGSTGFVEIDKYLM